MCCRVCPIGSARASCTIPPVSTPPPASSTSTSLGRRKTFSVAPRLAPVGRLPRDRAAPPDRTSPTATPPATRRSPSSRVVPRRSARSGPHAPRTRCPSSCPATASSGPTAASAATSAGRTPRRRSSSSRPPHDTDELQIDLARSARRRPRLERGVRRSRRGRHRRRSARSSTTTSAGDLGGALRPSERVPLDDRHGPPPIRRRASTATSRTRCQTLSPNCERRSGRTCSRSHATGRPDSHGLHRGPTTSMRGSRSVTPPASHDPTPLMLRYRPGDWNALHRDLYGDLVFPLQVVIGLDRPDVDYTGGEFVVVEQRPRAQSRATTRTIPLGHGIVFTTRDRPIRSSLAGMDRLHRCATASARCTAGNGTRWASSFTTPSSAAPTRRGSLRSRPSRPCRRPGRARRWGSGACRPLCRRPRGSPSRVP